MRHQLQGGARGNRSSSGFSDSGSGGLPLPANSKTCMSAAAKRWRYMRRLLHFRQMDFEFAFWQIAYLVVAPKRVYKEFSYRKHTKYQYARDDPAFLVLLSGFLVLSTALVSWALSLTFLQYLLFMVYVIVVDVIGVGMVVATALWFLTNKFMIRPNVRGTEDVEWGFCFDVHLNAFFPVLFILHCVEVVLVLCPDIFLVTVVANLLWWMALFYYVYISFLGYTSLGILKDTGIFLLPLAPITLFIFVSICLNWNLCWSLMHFYRDRLLISA